MAFFPYRDYFRTIHWSDVAGFQKKDLLIIQYLPETHLKLRGNYGAGMSQIWNR